MFDPAIVVALGKVGIDVITKIPAFYKAVSRHRLMKMVLTDNKSVKFELVINKKVADSLSSIEKSNLEEMGKYISMIASSLDFTTKSVEQVRKSRGDFYKLIEDKKSGLMTNGKNIKLDDSVVDMSALYKFLDNDAGDLCSDIDEGSRANEVPKFETKGSKFIENHKPTSKELDVLRNITDDEYEICRDELANWLDINLIDLD